VFKVALQLAGRLVGMTVVVGNRRLSFAQSGSLGLIRHMCQPRKLIFRPAIGREETSEFAFRKGTEENDGVVRRKSAILST
jgi:hypothetical protein